MANKNDVRNGDMPLLYVAVDLFVISLYREALL